MQTVECHCNDIQVPKGTHYPDEAKLQAALNAREVISKWFKERPTKTVNGTFYKLASVIYEGGTGKAEADLQRFCIRAVSGKDD